MRLKIYTIALTPLRFVWLSLLQFPFAHLANLNRLHYSIYPVVDTHLSGKIQKFSDKYHHSSPRKKRQRILNPRFVQDSNGQYIQEMFQVIFVLSHKLLVFYY